MELTIVDLALQEGRVNKALDWLRTFDFDVLCLQEVHDYPYQEVVSHCPNQTYNSLELLTQYAFRGLYNPYAYYGPAFQRLMFNDALTVTQGNTILSRYPLSDTWTTFFEHRPAIINQEGPLDYITTPRNMIHAKAHINNTDLSIITLQGPWDIQEKDNNKRIAMAKMIVEYASEYPNLIICGDFNCIPETKTGRILSDNFNHATEGVETTINLKRRLPSPVARFDKMNIDRFYASYSITYKKFRVVSPEEADVSDHCPVVAVFEI